MIVFTLWSFSADGSTPARPHSADSDGGHRRRARYHPDGSVCHPHRLRRWLVAMGAALLVPVTATAAPIPLPPVGLPAPLTVPIHHQSIGLPIIEPMLLLEVFAQLSPIVGSPIAFDLRREHPELGSRQVALGSDVLSVAAKLDAAGLGLADLTAIECRSPACLVRFDVDTRRIELVGSETVLAWALPVMDRLLATSPLSVTLQGTGDKSAVTITNHGAEAWLVTELRVAEGKTQRLSVPIAGHLQPDGDGWRIRPARLQVSLESEYQGLLPPGVTRTFALAKAPPAGTSCGISLVAYRLAEPAVFGGLFLKLKGATAFRPIAPPWDQWQATPLLVLGPWPPALIVLRQCSTVDEQAANQQGH